MHLRQPLIDPLSGSGKMEQSRRLRQQLSSATLWAKHTEIRKREFEGNNEARTRESCSKLCVITTAASLGSKLRCAGAASGQIGNGQYANLIRRREALARSQIRPAIRDRHKPSQFASQLRKRLCIVARAENPKTGARSTIISPNPRLKTFEANSGFRGRMPLQRRRSQIG